MATLFMSTPKTSDHRRASNGLPSRKKIRENGKSRTSRTFDALIKKNRLLLKITSVFPLDLFPNELLIDENKISVFTKKFFFTEDIRCITYKDIQSIEIFAGPFFASLYIRVFGIPNDRIEIKNVFRPQALRARRLIQGLMEASKADIDLSLFEKQEVISRAELLGSAHS